MSAAERLIHELNDAWLAEDFERIAACYHPGVILLPPDAGAPIIGLDAVLSSYREFSSQAKLLDFEVTDLHTYPIDALSAVHMRFDVKYQVKGEDEEFEESGMEIYWLDASPSIIWRHQMVLGSI